MSVDLGHSSVRPLASSCSTAPFAGSAWWLYGVPWGCLVFGTLCGWLFPVAARHWGAPFLLLSSLAFGMPHGAGDWMTLTKKNFRGLNQKTARILLWLYVPLCSLVLCVWWQNSAIALVGFLALTAWHWGSADAWQLFPSVWRARPWAWALFAVGRGLLLMCAPLALRPGESEAFLYGFVALTQKPVVMGLIGWAPYFFACSLLLQAAGWFSSGTGAIVSMTRSALETVLLVALFAATPPLLAISIYFVGVHSWRHLGRIFSLEGIAPSYWWKEIWWFHCRTWPVALAALVGCVPIVFLWPSLQRGVANWSIVYLILISALTFPHALVVGVLDRFVWKDCAGANS